MLKKILFVLSLIVLVAGSNKAHAQYSWNLANTGDAQCTVPITNDPSTGTVLNNFVTITTAGKAINATTATTSGIVGVVVGNAGVTGQAEVQVCGTALVNFSGGVTGGDYVIPSTVTAGKGEDSGSSAPSSGVENLGVILSPTTAGAGQYLVLLSDNYAGASGGSVTSITVTVPAGFAVTPSTITTSGTFALSYATGQTENEFLATPNGSSGALGLRALTCGDEPALTGDTTTSAGSCATTVKAVQGNALAPHRVTTSGSTLAVALGSSLNQFITLHDTITLSFSSAPADGNVVRFKLTQSNGGSHTVTWPLTVQWPGGSAPTLTTTNGQSDWLFCVYDATTTNYGCGSMLNFTP